MVFKVTECLALFDLRDLGFQHQSWFSWTWLAVSNDVSLEGRDDKSPEVNGIGSSERCQQQWEWRESGLMTLMTLLCRSFIPWFSHIQPLLPQTYLPLIVHRVFFQASSYCILILVESSVFTGLKCPLARTFLRYGRGYHGILIRSTKPSCHKEVSRIFSGCPTELASWYAQVTAHLRSSDRRCDHRKGPHSFRPWNMAAMALGNHL